MKRSAFHAVGVPWAVTLLALATLAMAPTPGISGAEAAGFELPGKAVASSPSPLPASNTGLSGYLRDANRGEGLPGYVYLYAAGDPAVEYEAWAYPNGYYAVTVPAGTYDAYGAMIGYGRVDTTVVITEGETTHLDLDLPAPILGWEPKAIGQALDAGATRVITMVLSNTGSGDLYYRIDEVAPGTDLPASARARPLPGGVDPQVYADLEASPDGTAEVLVVMAEQADLSAAYQISDWNARGWYVYNTLRATAERSQARLRAGLEEQGTPYRPHLSLNSLTLVADRATVTSLAAMPEVDSLQPAASFDLPEPGIEETGAPAFIGWNLKKVAADRVWDEFGVTGQGIVVASIDTGVAWTHPALKSQYRGWDGTTAEHDYNWWDPRGVCSPAGEPCDNYWHGTHVMGIMVGSDLPQDPLHAPNAIGMAPGARWMACKGCEMADGWSCSTFALLECADFILAPWDQNRQNPNPDLRPNVVNNSWGGSENDGWYYTVIAAWRAAGIFPAFSAGNGGPDCNTVNSPGDYVNAFATGATDSSDNIAYFSSRGPSALGQLKPDVTAPGDSVRSAVPGNSYGLGSGTSMASPHTAGEVALLWSAQPALVGQVGQTERLIEQMADGLTTPQTCDGAPGSEVPNNTFGWGRINAYRAVSVALAYDWDVSWLAVSPASGSLQAGDAASVNVTFDGAALAPHTCYTAELEIESNDPYQGLDVPVPVELCLSCEGLAGATISGPQALVAGEAGTFSVTLDPPTATLPVDILWSNGTAGPSAVYSWTSAITHTLVVTAANCAGTARVTDSLHVVVSRTLNRIYLPLLLLESVNK
jgi:subtilisin family serine protease